MREKPRPSRSVAVIGLGYVGLPLALALSKSGLKIIGFDTATDLIAGLKQGRSHIGDIASIDVTEFLTRGGIFTGSAGDLRGADAYVICVPTPLGKDGFPDLSAVESACLLVGKNMVPGSLVVLESTTYPGTTEEVVLPILARESGLKAGEDFYLAYSPERIDPGNPDYGIGNTPKVVGGLTEQSLRLAEELYQNLGITVVRASGLREAEMSKLLENTYRHVNIALVNEMARFCRALDIDIRDAIRCASTKPFGYAAFKPGPGVGGHCIPIDPNYLSHRVRTKLGYPFKFVELAQEINASMPAYTVTRVQELLNESSQSLRDAHLLVLGMSYKPNIADTRESPSRTVISQLLSFGAVVTACDPYVSPGFGLEIGVTEISIAELSNKSSSKKFDLVLLMQMHSHFADLNYKNLGNVVLDTQGELLGDNIFGL